MFMFKTMTMSRHPPASANSAPDALFVFHEGLIYNLAMLVWSFYGLYFPADSLYLFGFE